MGKNDEKSRNVKILTESVIFQGVVIYHLWRQNEIPPITVDIYGKKCYYKIPT